MKKEIEDKIKDFKQKELLELTNNPQLAAEKKIKKNLAKRKRKKLNKFKIDHKVLKK